MERYGILTVYNEYLDKWDGNVVYYMPEQAKTIVNVRYGCITVIIF